MKNNSEYMNLVKVARENQLKLIQNQYEEIRNIYKAVAESLSIKSSKAKQGSLTERWLNDYQKAIQEEIKQLDKILYIKNKEAVNTASQIASSVQLDFFNLVDNKFDLGMYKTFKFMFSKVPNEILAEMLNGGFYKDDKSLASRIWANGNKLNGDIKYIINKAIAEKKSAYELAKDLENYINPDAKKDFQWKKVYPGVGNKKVDYNAQRLARTSINHAYFMSNHRSCERNPFIECMHWELSNSHYDRQVKKWGKDICDKYAESDDYGLGTGNYPVKGSDRFPHPHCLCIQYAVIPDSLEAIGTRLGNWVDGSRDIVLDRWYKEYGLEFAVQG